MLDRLALTLGLGSLLDAVVERYGGYQLLDHWQQGEFHHDLVLMLPEAAVPELPGRVLVVSTNCNGGVKEVLAFESAPDRKALWAHRCEQAVLGILGCARTIHWFDPCELLVEDARSELKPECRRRQDGGGWEAL